jgi:hypothetical protein
VAAGAEPFGRGRSECAHPDRSFLPSINNEFRRPRSVRQNNDRSENMEDAGRAKRSTTRRALALLATAALASACGGGGSSAPAAPNLSAAPGAQALNAYYKAPHQNTFSTNYAGNTFTIQLSFTPNAGTISFAGNPSVNSATETVVLTQNGATVSTVTETVYYAVDPFVPYGSLNANGYEYTVVQSYSPIPATISVGQSGALTTSTTWHDNTQAATDATTTTTFSVLADTPTTVQFCTNAAISAIIPNPDSLTSGTETDCYRVDAGGNAALYKVTVSESGLNLTFQ